MNCYEIIKRLDAEFVSFQESLHGTTILCQGEVRYLYALIELRDAFNRIAYHESDMYEPTPEEIKREIETVSAGRWFNKNLYRLFD